jgi:hypothetical protein
MHYTTKIFSFVASHSMVVHNTGVVKRLLSEISGVEFVCAFAKVGPSALRGVPPHKVNKKDA